MDCAIRPERLRGPSRAMLSDPGADFSSAISSASVLALTSGLTRTTWLLRAVIIGKPGRHITRTNAWSHIAGYACYNEGSVRDFQRHTHQFTPGKNFPGTGAFGPWMMTPDALGDAPPLRLQTRPNGQIVHAARIAQMVF